MSGTSPEIDLRPDHWNIVRDILRRHVPDRKVLAFGSRTSWTAKNYSDLDLAILGDTPQSLELISALSEDFEESDLPFKVDLVDWALTDKTFRNIIRCNHVTVQDPFVKFGEIATLARDTVLPGKMGNLPYVGLEHIGENSLGLTGTGSAKDVQSTKFRFNKGDILFGKLRPYFRKVVRARMDGICSTDIWVVRPVSDVDPGYLLYLMASPGFVDCAVRGSEGTKMPRAKWEFVARHHFLLPPIPEQRAIAHILGTLDDKIEGNRRMNETLEAMARAIFRDWFVEFGPVRAKVEGRASYLAPELWGRFPDRLDDEGKPVGWTYSEIGKEVRAVGGGTPSTKEQSYWSGGDHYWATPKDLSKLEAPVLLSTDRKITDAGVSKISSGLLPIGTVLLSSRAPIGYLAITEVPTAINQGFIAMVCQQRLPNTFVLLWCHENLDYIKGIASGSTFAEISKRAFRPVPVVVPSEPILTAYDGLIRPLYDRIVMNTKESETLTETRDLLLPKFMSGEIRLRDAGKMVEVVA